MRKNITKKRGRARWPNPVTHHTYTSPKEGRGASVEHALSMPAPPPPTSQVQRFSVVSRGGGGGGASSTAQVLDLTEGGGGAPPPPPLSRTAAAAAAAADHPGRPGGGGNGSHTVRAHPDSRRPVSDAFEGRPLTSGAADGSGGGGGGNGRRLSSAGGPPDDFLHMLPSNIQASLRTFEELQLQKTDLLASRFPSSASLTAARQATPPTCDLPRSHSTGRMPSLQERDAQRKLAVAESVMKKLHKKNQRLSQEVASLKTELGRGGGDEEAPQHKGGGAAHATAAADPEELRSLRQRVRELEAAGQRGGGGGQAVPQQQQQPQRSAELQEQYKQLLDSSIASVTDLTSTSKINKEVKAFFVLLRKKIHSDMVAHEVDRFVWNAHMTDVEEKVIVVLFSSLFTRCVCEMPPFIGMRFCDILTNILTNTAVREACSRLPGARRRSFCTVTPQRKGEEEK